VRDVGDAAGRDGLGVDRVPALRRYVEVEVVDLRLVEEDAAAVVGAKQPVRAPIAVCAAGAVIVAVTQADDVVLPFLQRPVGAGVEAAGGEAELDGHDAGDLGVPYTLVDDAMLHAPDLGLHAADHVARVGVDEAAGDDREVGGDDVDPTRERLLQLGDRGREVGGAVDAAAARGVGGGGRGCRWWPRRWCRRRCRSWSADRRCRRCSRRPRWRRRHRLSRGPGEGGARCAA
jgi:hypothetical protein